MSRTSPVFDLDDPRALDEALCGHSIAVLARLRRQDLPVQHLELLPLPVDQEALAPDLQRWRRQRRSLRLWPAENLGRQKPLVGGLPEIQSSIAELQARPPGKAPRCLCIQLDHPNPGRLEIALHGPTGAMPRLWCLRQLGSSGSAFVLLREDGMLASRALPPDSLNLGTRLRALQLVLRARRELPELRSLQMECRHGGLSIVAADDGDEGVVEVEHLGARPAGLEIWSRFVLRENLRAPLRPLSLDLWRRIFLPVIFETLTGLPQRATRERRMQPVDRVAGRLYFNANRLLATPMGMLLLRLAPLLDQSAGTQLRSALEAHDLDRPTLAGLRKLWALGNGLRGLARLLGRMLRGLRAHKTIQFYRRHALDALKASRRDRGDLDDAALLALIEHAQLRHRELLQQGLAHELLAGIVARLAPPGETRVIDPPSPSADLLQRCAELAEQLHLGESSLPELSVERIESQAPQAWAKLLDLHGHRGLNELELASPRLSDQPEILVTAIAHALLPQPRAKSPEIGSVERWLAEIAQLRDWPGWAFAAGLQELRSLYLELGKRLHQRGLLPSGQAIFWIDHETAQDLLLERRQDLLPVIDSMDRARRQAAQHASCKPDDLLRSDGAAKPIGRESDETPTTVCGLGVGDALIEAPSCWVGDPPQAPPPGSILIFEVFTAGHVPLLSGCAGLVVESGDASSLATLVARQLGLPALVGTADMRRALRKATRLRLDATAGQVSVITRD